MDEIRRMFGDKFLAYVLACDISKFDDEEWSEEQGLVIQALQSFSSVLSGQQPYEQNLNMANYLIAPSQENVLSAAETWHLTCGGEDVRRSAVDNPPLDALWKLAMLVYPALLLPESRDVGLGPQLSVSPILFNRPAQLDFCRAVLHDDILTLLFPGQSDEGVLLTMDQLLTAQSYLQLSSGRGGTFQLWLLSEFILQSAHSRTAAYGVSGLDAYLDAVEESLADVRRLAAGDEVKVPAVIGLTNLRLAEGVVIELPWGVLRSPTDEDRQFQPDKNAPTAILLAKVSLKIIGKKPWGAGEEIDLTSLGQHYPTFEQWDKELQRSIDLTRYALLCASAGKLYFAAKHFSTSLLDPLQSAPQMRWAFAVPAAAPETAVDLDAVVRVESWGRQLATHHPRSLDIAMRRTLSAIIDRLDPLDGFIDAVLTWENMFSSTPETTFKVCGAMAVLLEPDDSAARSTLFKELQELYRKRSAVVHGSPEPSVQESSVYRDRAVDLALASMRRLYEHKDLLQVESKVRGRDIMLGIGGFALTE